MDITNPQDRGRFGEELALEYFLKRDYQLLARNYRTRYGEIDVVVEKGEVVVFIEVRTRQNNGMGAPVETITRAKRHRLIKTALHFIQRKRMQNRQFRFDVFIIDGQNLEHIENAFYSSRLYTF